MKISDRLASWLLSGFCLMNPSPTEGEIIREIDRLWDKLGTVPPALDDEVADLLDYGEPGVILRAIALQRMGALS